MKKYTRRGGAIGHNLIQANKLFSRLARPLFTAASRANQRGAIAFCFCHHYSALPRPYKIKSFFGGIN